MQWMRPAGLAQPHGPRAYACSEMAMSTCVKLMIAGSVAARWQGLAFLSGITIRNELPATVHRFLGT